MGSAGLCQALAGSDEKRDLGGRETEKRREGPIKKERGRKRRRKKTGETEDGGGGRTWINVGQRGQKA
jgi:hypothetical protein